MAENTTVNKVVINNETVIDITDTTATPESVAQGQVFYKASGERAVGSMVETDPVFAASPAYDITSSDITNWNNKTSNIGTITGVSVNGTSIATSGVADVPVPTKTSELTNDRGFVVSNTVPSAYCITAADTAAKAAACTNYTLTDNTYLHFNIRYANTSAAAITMNVNSKGAKPIYINGVASSSSNYTLPAGSYIAFYDGTNWYFRTDGKLPAKIDGDAATVNGHSVAKDVPSNAVFTDTTALTSMTGTLGVGHGGTGATSASAAKTNLGILSTFNVKSFVAASNTTTTLTVTSNSRVAIYAFSYAALCEFLISSTSTGDVSHSKIGTAASISISATGTNSVTFNNTGNSVQLYAIIFLGDVSS